MRAGNCVNQYKNDKIENKEKIIFNFDFKKEWEYENGFYLTSDTSRLAKILAHWELYKKIINLPGDVVECGVFKGASLLRFATYREIMESQNSRKIIGFDAFGIFPKRTSSTEDLAFINSFEKDCGNGISKTELEEVLRYKLIYNVELVQGDICNTLPTYLFKNPFLKSPSCISTSMCMNLQNIA